MYRTVESRKVYWWFTSWTVKVVIVYQASDVRKDHPWQKEQHMRGHEVVHLSGPAPSTGNAPATPWAAETLLPLWGSPEVRFLWTFGLLHSCPWADWSWELCPFRALSPCNVLTSPPWAWLFFSWHYKPYVECGARWSFDTKHSVCSTRWEFNMHFLVFCLLSKVFLC